MTYDFPAQDFDLLWVFGMLLGYKYVLLMSHDIYYSNRSVRWALKKFIMTAS